MIQTCRLSWAQSLNHAPFQLTCLGCGIHACAQWGKWHFYSKLTHCSYFILPKGRKQFIPAVTFLLRTFFFFFCCGHASQCFLLPFVSHSAFPLSISLQADLLPGGFSVFRGFIQQGGNSGREWHHITCSPQREHSGMTHHCLEDKHPRARVVCLFSPCSLSLMHYLGQQCREYTVVFLDFLIEGNLFKFYYSWLYFANLITV